MSRSFSRLCLTLLILATLAIPTNAAAGYWKTVDSGNQPRFSASDPQPFDDLSRFRAGDFDGDGADEVLVINYENLEKGSWYLADYDGSSWSVLDSGTNIGVCSSCELWGFDKFYVGDFNGDGRDDLLKIRGTQLWRMDSWTPAFGWGFMASSSNFTLGSWGMSTNDAYYVGDFVGNGSAELLAIDAANGHNQTMEMDFSFPPDWTTIDGSMNGQIHFWGISPQDTYVTGDFNGSGEVDLLALNPSNGWHHTMTFDNLRPFGDQWQWIEGNGSGQLGLWYLAASDFYLTGDFNSDGKDEVLAVNRSNGWSHTIELAGKKWFSWNWLAGNSGNSMIGSFSMSFAPKFDRWVTGDFNGDGTDELLVLVANPKVGFWQLVMF